MKGEGAAWDGERAGIAHYPRPTFSSRNPFHPREPLAIVSEASLASPPNEHRLVVVVCSSRNSRFLFFPYVTA